MKYNYRKKWLRESSLEGLPNNLKKLLIDNSSLTKRLAMKSSIRVLSSKMHLTKERIHTSKRYSLVRKVQLQGKLEKPILATSYTPVTSIRGRLIAIKFLKDRSLASLLFKKPKFKKKSIEYKIFSDHVTRLTFFERRSLRIKVEEVFPKKNNYPDLRLIECRGNIVY